MAHDISDTPAETFHIKIGSITAADPQLNTSCL